MDLDEAICNAAHIFTSKLVYAVVAIGILLKPQDYLLCKLLINFHRR